MHSRLNGSLGRILHSTSPRYWDCTSRCDRGALQVAMDGKKPESSSSKPLKEAHEFLGDYGARDPFAAEVESNFSDKVQGYADTEHLIAPPDEISKVLGLSSKKCKPCEGGNVEMLDEDTVNRLSNQAPGWKVVDVDGMKRIRQEWKVRNFVSGLELFKRISVVAEEQGHHPDLHLEGYNNARVELWTHSAGGLTENDFIMASQINEVDVSDLKKKPRKQYWA